MVISPLLVVSLVVSLVALTVALPIGLMSAIYMAEYAGPRVRGVFKPILEILAGIPTIVYGVFALRSGIPFAKDFFNGLEWLLELCGPGPVPSPRHVVDVPPASPGHDLHPGHHADGAPVPGE